MGSRRQSCWPVEYIPSRDATARGSSFVSECASRASDTERYPVTPDERYVLMRGKLWRRANPALPVEARRELVQELKAAPLAAAAKRAADLEGEKLRMRRSMRSSGLWPNAGRSGGRTALWISTVVWRRTHLTPNGLRSCRPRRNSAYADVSHAATPGERSGGFEHADRARLPRQAVPHTALAG